MFPKIIQIWYNERVEEILPAGSNLLVRFGPTSKQFRLRGTMGRLKLSLDFRISLNPSCHLSPALKQ
jgi:hypothetical protein